MGWSDLRKIMLRLFLFWGVTFILMVTGSGSQAISNLDAQFTPGGIISGRVTDDSGNGIKGIIVDIYDLNQFGIAYTYTDSAGRYSIDAIPEGSYKIYFGGSFNGNYLGQWYHEAVSFDAADAVVVTAGLATPNIDAQLTTGGSINGHLTDYLGKNIQGIAVDIYDLNRTYIVSTSTNEAGNYSFGGLHDGIYKIYFAGSLQLNNRSEWYNDKNSFDAADPVAVTVGQITPNIDAQLTQGGILNGRVTDDLGAGLPDIIVDIYDLSHLHIDYTYTDKQGNYSFGGLPGGSYKIYFSAYRQNFFSQWYNGKTSFDTADPVAITAGQPGTNIDAQLAPGGSISGRVTDNLGEYIQGIAVDIYDLNHFYLASTITDSSGHYSVAGIPGGSYVIYFGSSNIQDYLGEWYNDKISFETADPVTVMVGQTTSAVDAQ
ncbi:MAG TPA: carboxypeptidase-like regulatory domain-containing protein, partial [Candidatus Deferrimicrobium sp.]|nr:carboxypeptidase-like regulatory domain-containing protein [Candidatus Deferrimicrobium sp.]